MNKGISYNLTIFLILVTFLTSCNENELKQEAFKYPIELSPIEISNTYDERFFIGGEEIFDTTLCKSFMRSEWIKMSDGSQRYNYFDETNFLKDYIPQNITFIAQDTALVDSSRFIVDRDNSFFIFYPFDNQYFTNNSNDFRENFNLEQTAIGNYIDLEYDIVNFRYHRNENDTPLWEDNNNGTKTFGMAGRIKGKIDYNCMVTSMHPRDTFVFQQYKIKYQALRRD